MKPDGETDPGACECGNPLPCLLHTPTHDLHLAYSALRRLTATERGLVLCWFCRWCHRYLAPGQPRLSCDQGMCLQNEGHEPDGDGKPIAIGEEITVKVDTAALAQRHDDARREHLLFNLRRELQLLSGRIKRAELLVLEAQRRTGALARDQRKN